MPLPPGYRSKVESRHFAHLWCTPTPLALNLPSRTQLKCTFLPRGQIHSPYLYSTPCTLRWETTFSANYCIWNNEHRSLFNIINSFKKEKFRKFQKIVSLHHIHETNDDLVCTVHCYSLENLSRHPLACLGKRRHTENWSHLLPTFTRAATHKFLLKKNIFYWTMDITKPYWRVFFRLRESIFSSLTYILKIKMHGF